MGGIPSADWPEAEDIWHAWNHSRVTEPALPRPLYKADSLLDYIEACVDELLRDHPSASIVLAGDLNQLTDSAVLERTGFVQLVQEPIRGQSLLDRLFVSAPLYEPVRV